jgi:hypothetical protein
MSEVVEHQSSVEEESNVVITAEKKQSTVSTKAAAADVRAHEVNAKDSIFAGKHQPLRTSKDNVEPAESPEKQSVAEEHRFQALHLVIPAATITGEAPASGCMSRYVLRPAHVVAVNHQTADGE